MLPFLKKFKKEHNTENISDNELIGNTTENFHKLFNLFGPDLNQNLSIFQLISFQELILRNES